MSGHRRDIRILDPNKPVGEHARRFKHVKFFIQVIDANMANNAFRIQAEEIWIRTLVSRAPRGLNLQY
jgi:hypothetical protein